MRRMPLRVVAFLITCSLKSMASNHAAHPEPLKRRTVSFRSSRRPGGRER